jgi:hypothetical protein
MTGVTAPSARDVGPSCAPPALVTTVEAADAGFSNTCIHGQWYLEALNGTTMPAAPGRPNNLWMKYQIPFASLTQIGFGNQSPTGAAFPRSAITLLKWDIGVPMTGPTDPWDLSVDDLTFY